MRSMRRGEVWWVDFDPARDGEIRKMRPAVIVSNDLSNTHLNRLQAPGLQALKNGSNTLAATNAHGHQCVAALDAV